MEFKAGTNVGIKHDCEQYGGKLNGRCGVVVFSCNYNDNDKIAVLIEGTANPNSRYGYYYFWPNDLFTFDGKPYYEKPKNSYAYFAIKNVYFNKPVTVIMWEDGTKTIVKCGENDVYDPEKGLAMACAKKALGNTGNYRKQFKKWLPEAECCHSCESDNHKCQEPIDIEK